MFGGNDGLVSNLALVMGVAGAAPAPGVIVLAGIAGLLAGAFSMAVGEYISVQSQRELLRIPDRVRAAATGDHPEKEHDILVGIYVERGLTPRGGSAVRRSHVRGSRAGARRARAGGDRPRSPGHRVAQECRLGSFLAFTLGALVPVVPYLLGSGAVAFWTSLLASLAGLFLLGIGVSQFTHRDPCAQAPDSCSSGSPPRA